MDGGRQLRIGEGKPTMCEYCKETEVKFRNLEADEKTECEWISEELGPGACDRDAVYFVSEWYVEQHLCALHKTETEAEMNDEDLSGFLDAAGFSSEAELRPIQAEEACDAVVPAGEEWTACNKKATHAKYVLNESALCAQHLAELQADAAAK
jgi:hypothetical protein